MRSFVVLIAAAPVAAAAFAQSPPSPFHRTADLLIADAQGGRVLRAHDADGDGRFNTPGELMLYFDPSLAIDPTTGAPYAVPLSQPRSIAVDRFGWTYVASAGSPSAVFRLRDLDGDGTAMGPGESSLFVGPGNAASLSVYPLTGLAFDGQDRLWVTVDGPFNDYVYQLRDLNGDGDANDPGEQTLVYDDAVSATHGNPPLFGVAGGAFTDSGEFFLTNTAPFHQFVVKLVDLAPQDGRFDGPGEVQVMYAGGAGVPAIKASWCARRGTDGRLYVYNSVDHTLTASADLNHDGSFAGAGEAITFAASGDSGIAVDEAYVFDRAADGGVIVGVTGAAPRLVLYQDHNQDGDARDAGEAAVVLDFALSPFPNAAPRSVLFLPEEPASIGGGRLTGSGLAPELRWESSGGLPILGNTQFAMSIIGAAAGSPTGVLFSSSEAPISLESVAPGAGDAGCSIIPDVFSPDFGSFSPALPADAFGNVAIPLPLTAPPALAGMRFTLQGITIDASKPAPVVLTNALRVPLL